jgi:hypothetical protein
VGRWSRGAVREAVTRSADVCRNREGSASIDGRFAVVFQSGHGRGTVVSPSESPRTPWHGKITGTDRDNSAYVTKRLTEQATERLTGRASSKWNLSVVVKGGRRSSRRSRSTPPSSLNASGARLPPLITLGVHVGDDFVPTRMSPVPCEQRAL